MRLESFKQQIYETAKDIVLYTLLLNGLVFACVSIAHALEMIGS